MKNNKNAHSHKPIISSIILAAGKSTRMGTQKLLLTWKDTTVIQSVVRTLQMGGSNNILIVTGASHLQLVDLFINSPEIRLVYNDRFEQTEMLQSLQLGLRSLPKETDAFFLVLGDQPQIKINTVQELKKQCVAGESQIIIPSFEMKRGHPWLVSIDFIEEIQSLSPEKTLRDFLNAHKEEITYVNVKDEKILNDLDTPLDYERDRPK